MVALAAAAAGGDPRPLRDPGLLLGGCPERDREHRLLPGPVRGHVRAAHHGAVDPGLARPGARRGRRSRRRLRPDRDLPVERQGPVPEPRALRRQPAPCLLPRELALLRPQHPRPLPCAGDHGAWRLHGVVGRTSRPGAGRDRRRGLPHRARGQLLDHQLRRRDRRARDRRAAALGLAWSGRCGRSRPRRPRGPRHRGRNSDQRHPGLPLHRQRARIAARGRRPAVRGQAGGRMGLGRLRPGVLRGDRAGALDGLALRARDRRRRAGRGRARRLRRVPDHGHDRAVRPRPRVAPPRDRRRVLRRGVRPQPRVRGLCDRPRDVGPARPRRRCAAVPDDSGFCDRPRGSHDGPLRIGASASSRAHARRALPARHAIARRDASAGEH